MSENVPVDTKSKKSKKNKNKNKEEKHEHGEHCHHDHDHSAHAKPTLPAGGDFMSAFSKIFGQETNVDFSNFDTHTEAIRSEITTIRAVLEDINTGKFNLISEPEKESNQNLKNSN
jgi:hypothetical protein